jgi:hypothetical protein
MDEFQAKMTAAAQTKTKATDAINKNNTLIEKLKEFIPAGV